jgi:hypothetical protein
MEDRRWRMDGRMIQSQFGESVVLKPVAGVGASKQKGELYWWMR